MSIFFRYVIKAKVTIIMVTLHICEVLLPECKYT